MGITLLGYGLVDADPLSILTGPGDQSTGEMDELDAMFRDFQETSDSTDSPETGGSDSNASSVAAIQPNETSEPAYGGLYIPEKASAEAPRILEPRRSISATQADTAATSRDTRAASGILQESSLQRRSRIFSTESQSSAPEQTLTIPGSMVSSAPDQDLRKPRPAPARPGNKVRPVSIRLTGNIHPLP